MLSAAARLEPMIFTSEFELREMLPAEEISLARLVVLSVIFSQDFFLEPPRSSVLFLSWRAAMLMSPPAVILT